MTGPPPPPRRLSVRIEGAIVAVLLATFTAMIVGQARHSSVTVDEFHLVPQAVALRATGDLELGYKTPPLLKRWIGLAIAPESVELPDHHIDGKAASGGWNPWIFGTRFMTVNRADYDRIFLRARVMMLPLAWALALAIWAWARSCGGQIAGLTALGFTAFSPELISYSSLVSLDLGVSALVVGFLALARLHARGGSWWSLAAAGLVFGLGLSVKLSVLFLVPMFVLVLFGPGVRHKPWSSRLGALALAIIAALAAIHASYGFDHPVVRWGDFRPTSASLRSVHGAIPAATPVPLPLWWLRAVDGQARDVESADVLSYLDGEWSERGWRRYYVLAWLYKSPVPMHCIVAFLAGWWAWHGTRALRRRDARRGPDPFETLFVFLPIVLWLGAFSLAGGLDIGIRYVLPCYPVAAVALGVLAAPILARSAAGAFTALLLLAYATATVLAYPHHLSYMNRLAGGDEGAWRRLADSNVDWGQELKHLSAVMREREIGRIGLGYFGHVAPELYGIDYFIPDGEPAPGWYAISANFVAGYSYLAFDHGQLRMTREDQFAAFRTREPVATLGGALLLYRVDALH